MLQSFGIDIPRTLDEAISLDRTALLVYDMQVGIMSQMPGAESIVARVKTVRETAREVGLRTYFVRHRSLPSVVLPKSLAHDRSL